MVLQFLWASHLSITTNVIVVVKFVFLDSGPQTELVAQLAQEFYNLDVLLHLINNLGKLDFEVIFKTEFLPPHPCPEMHTVCTLLLFIRNKNNN